MANLNSSNRTGFEMFPVLLESIPLAEAVLCVDCNVITRAKNGHCPVCEFTSLLNLATVLDRQADGEK